MKSSKIFGGFIFLYYICTKKTKLVMTREDKDLLIKDLCGRLPYGVKVYIPEINIVRTLGTVQYDEENTLFDFWDETHTRYEHQLYLSEFKPYLFPLSSMTVEQRCKAQNLLPNKCEISFINSKITFYGEDCCVVELEQFDKLFKFFDSQHVDYRGLISKGLALDATGLNIY